jgi:DNA repair exonuclease SbcCD ATPase subunit
VTGKTQRHEVDAAVLAFVVERVKILYEDVEYVDAIDQLLRDRLLVHRDIVTAQNDKAAAVRSNVNAAKQSLKGLQQKMERALAVQQNLSKRAAAVLQAVKENQPNLSRAEREYKSELERLAIDVRRMQPQVTQLTVSGQRLVRSLEAAGRNTNSLDSSMSSGVGAVLTDDKKRMCYDVLRAETQLIDDTKSLLEELSAGLQQLRT